MRKADAFAGCHPLVNFLYFALVLGFSMALLHPVTLLISLTAAAAYAVRLRGAVAVRFGLRYMLPAAIAAMLVNPIFNHRGVTILAYLPSGNPLTLESILYGLAAAILVAAVLLWFLCWNAVLTSDKFIWLFGRIIPSLSLVLALVLRFVPRFRVQLEAVRQARHGVGRDAADGKGRERVRHAAALLSALLGWSMENALETANSMRSRGYGLAGRTAYTVYRFTARDGYAAVWLCFCGLYCFVGALAGGMDWQYVPLLRGGPVTGLSVSFFAVYALLCATPLLMQIREGRVWRA